MSALFLFASLGVVNGILLSVYLIARKDRSLSDVYFAGLLLSLCIRIGKSVLVYFNPELDRLILQIGLSACLFIGPFYYLYSKAIHNQSKEVSVSDRLILVILLVVIFVVGLLSPYRQFPDQWNGVIIHSIYITWGVFALLGLYENRQVFRKLFSVNNALDGTEKRLLIISLAFVFITLTYQFALFVKGVTYIWGSIIFTISFYYLAIKVLIEKKAPVPKSSGNKPLPNGPQLLQQLDQLMASEKPYINPKLKLDELSRLAGMSRHTLSQLLNDTYEFGFSHYIKTYRVNEAKQLIRSRHELSLEGIGYEAGFVSKSSFFDAFKKLTGQTPASFKKSLAEKEVLISPD